MTERPTVAAVLLTMGTRPVEFPRALESLLAQRGVDLDVLVVGNGWEPTGLPAGVRTLHLPENVGIPEGRNLGAAEARGDVIFFYDDDAYLPTPDVLARLVAVLDRDRRVAAVQPRPVDPTGKPSPARWVPRLGGRDPLRPGVVAWIWEGTFVIRRDVFERVGGWPGHFFYAHEGIDLMWKVWDAGYVGWYAPDIVMNHPATSPTRHAAYYRMNARNRVWVALRNLPAPLVPAYLLVWTLLTVARVRSPGTLRVWGAGFREGLAGGYGERRPMSWRTVLRLTRAGRPPVV
ncbi:MAG: glycosyltransferase family 2 protein [Actinomycetes bacterium]